jgi:hypothetical protein
MRLFALCFAQFKFAWVRQLSRSLKFSILVIVSLLVATACINDSSMHDKSSATESSSTVNCRIIHHAMGDTCVSANPQRVVVWGGTELDPVLALGVKPIAGNPHVLTYIQELPPEQWQGIENIDSPQGPNFEYLLELKPDLILGQCCQRTTSGRVRTRKTENRPAVETIAGCSTRKGLCRRRLFSRSRANNRKFNFG